MPPRRRGFRRAKALAAAAILLLAGVALGAGFETIGEWLGISVVAAERRTDGSYMEVVIDIPDGRRALLLPLNESPTAFDPRIDESAPLITLPREGGGRMSLRILRRGRRWFDEFFVSLDKGSSPEPGRQIRTRRVALVARVVREAEGRIEVLQSYDDGHLETLTLLPLPDDPRRYGDGETLVEVAGR